MPWTKRDYIKAAFEEIGLASYAYDLQPEQLEGALKKLDAMIASWNGKGIRLGYLIPSSPGDSDLDSDSGVFDYANEAVILGLAVRLAPGFGKTVSPDTKKNARAAYNVMTSKSAIPAERQFQKNLPLGAGNKPHHYDRVFIPKPSSPLIAGPDGELEFD